MRELRVLSILIGASLMLAACPSTDTPREEFRVELAGDNEVPPVATTATGRVTTRVIGDSLEIQGQFSGLESDLIEIAGSPAHIHEGGLDEAGPVVFNLNVFASPDLRSGSFAGRFELDAEQRARFEEGLYYVNIHTAENPAGELRGQLREDAPSFAAIDAAFDAVLLAEHETAEVDSDAEGTGTAILRGRELIVSGRFDGLTSPLVDIGDLGPAHIHEGAPGEDGPVVFPLDVHPEEDMLGGRFSLAESLTPEEIDVLRAGDYYINIHTEMFEPGEIRGQLVERD